MEATATLNRRQRRQAMRNSKSPNNHKNNQNFTNVLECAEKLGQLSIKSVVIDTENDYIKFGFAKSIASAMSANYYHFQQLSQQNILHIIKNQA